MVLPKEQIQEIDNQVAELEKEKEDLLIDTNILKRPDGTDFYLPKDPEKAELIKQTLKELKFLKQQFIKDEIDSAAQNALVRDFIRSKGLTIEELSGQYQSTAGAKVKAYINSLNTNIAQNLDNFIDVLYTPKDKIEKTGAYGPNAEELGITKDPGLVEEFFTWTQSIDPTFTPQTWGERIADAAGAGTADGLFLAIPTSRLSTTKKIVMDPTKYEGIIGKAKNTAVATWKGILDMYQDAAAKGNLSAVLLADMMAFAGWEGGAQFADELIGKGTTDDSEFTEELKNKSFEYGAPFVGALGGGTMGYTFWTLPKATYNMFNKLYKEFFPAVVQRYRDGDTLNPYRIFQENNNIKKEAKDKKRAAEIIQSTVNEEEIATREAAKEVEENIPGLNLSLAQQTENPKLVEEQRVIESTLTDLENAIPTIATRGKKAEDEAVASDIKTNILKNYKAVDDQVKKEFPDKQTIFKTDSNGNVQEVDDPIGSFYSYVNKDTGAEGSLVRSITDEITDVEKTLVPGSDETLLPSIDKTVLGEQGEQIRGEIISIKDKTLNFYSKELLDIFESQQPNLKIDITDFKDDIISKGALKSFEDPDNLPRQYLEIRDLGQEFNGFITRATSAMDAAYQKYLNEGINNTKAYETYLNTVKKIETNLKSSIEGLNAKLQKQKADGQRNTAPEYDLGEIIFKFPEFGSGASGKPGEGFLGRQDVVFDRPGVQVSLSYTEPSLNMTAKDMIELKQSVIKDLDLLSTDLFKNSEKIQRLAQINQSIDDLFRTELKGSDEYQKWLKLYEQNFKIPFQEGIINKVLTQTGQGGEYLIGSEVVGKAFLKDPASINRYFEIFGPAIQDGNLSYINGIKNSFLDDLYSKVLTKDGLIDANKLKKFEQQNREIIDQLNNYIPDLKKLINDNIELGVNAANRIKDLKARERYAGKIDLDQLAKDGFKGGLTFQDAESLIKQSLKDPGQMEKTVKAILASENSDAMLAAFKNEIFNTWMIATKNRPFKGELPNPKAMTKWLNDNEDVVKAFYKATGDTEGYDRLVRITTAYDKLNLTGYPGQADAKKPSIIKRVFGSDIPQILSRIFAVQSGRTSTRFIGAELGMRFFRQLADNKRQKIIAEALYDKNLAESLLKMMTNEPLSKSDINVLKGILGQVQGFMSNTLDDEIVEDREKNLRSDAEILNKATSSFDNASKAPAFVPKLNINNVSPASTLSNINMARMTQNTIPNTLARGQAIFGQDDPIFGGIAAV